MDSIHPKVMRTTAQPGTTVVEKKPGFKHYFNIVVIVVLLIIALGSYGYTYYIKDTTRLELEKKQMKIEALEKEKTDLHVQLDKAVQVLK